MNNPKFIPLKIYLKLYYNNGKKSLALQKYNKNFCSLLVSYVFMLAHRKSCLFSQEREKKSNRETIHLLFWGREEKWK